MLNNKSYWFYIEPYVHISLKRNCALLYNTLNGEALEYNGRPAIIKIIKRLRSSNNLLVVPLSKRDLIKPAILQFVESVKKHYVGDLIDASYSKEKPIELLPMLNIQRDVRKIKADPSRSIGEDMMRYLTEVSLYINNYCEQNCSICKDAYRQFLFCNKADDKQNELGIQKIKRFFEETRGALLSRINILGGDIFQYSHLKNLLDFFDTLTIPKVYYTHYLDVDNHASELALLRRAHSELAVLINFPLKIDALKNVVQLLDKNPIKTNYIFVIETEEQLINAENVAKKFKINDFSFHPYYNGKNIRFFKKNVFVSKKDIFESKPSYKEIFSRMCMNSLKFGKLTILSNGDIHADVNAPKLGRLGKDSLYDIIFKEMKSTRSWRRTRTQVEPCKRCPLDVLCPSLSNYEYAFGKNNLCHAWKEKAHSNKKMK